MFYANCLRILVAIGNLQLLIMGTIKMGLFDQVSADNLMTD